MLQFRHWPRGGSATSTIQTRGTGRGSSCDMLTTFYNMLTVTWRKCSNNSRIEDDCSTTSFFSPQKTGVFTNKNILFLLVT